MKTELIFEHESAAINNAVFEVHKQLGVGLQELLYQEALAIEFDYLGIPYEREKPYQVYYRGCRLKHHYFADFVCYDNIILEVKSVSTLTDQHKAQVRNYIGIAKKRLGLLYNFNEKFITPVRILNSNLRWMDDEDYY
ncbi:MAG: GxxExxY protein [Bacteroidales bacterium]|nr:GxxExxY protein [Bacteroidales bacterium]